MVVTLTGEARDAILGVEGLPEYRRMVERMGELVVAVETLEKELKRAREAERMMEKLKAELEEAARAFRGPDGSP